MADAYRERTIRRERKKGAGRGDGGRRTLLKKAISRYKARAGDLLFVCTVLLQRNEGDKRARARDRETKG